MFFLMGLAMIVVGQMMASYGESRPGYNDMSNQHPLFVQGRYLSLGGIVVMIVAAAKFCSDLGA